MRRAIPFALSAFAVLGAGNTSDAYPEQERRTPAFTLDWDSRPTGRDFERHYPRGAADARRSGVAILCCVVQADGTLDCASAYESPAGEGFGDAAVQIARAFRMKATDASAWTASGERIRVPIWFLMNRNPADPGLQAAQANVFEATQSICVAPTG